MASEDAENKPNHTEAAKPENKSKAKPKSRKAKPKPKKTAKGDETPDVKKAEAREGGSEQQTEAKPEAAAAPEAEKPAKKKAKSRGRKPKAKPKAGEAAQASAPAAEPAKPIAEKTEPAAPDQAEDQPGKQPDAGSQNPAPEADSSMPPAEGKKKSKAKRRGKPKKSKPAQDSPTPEVPQPATPPELAAEETIAEYEAGEQEGAEPVAADATELVSPPPAPPVPKQQPPLIIVASGNPAKIKAAELAFSRMFPDEKFDYEGIAVESGVSDQPMSDDETFAGAFMRAQHCRETRPEATYWVGLEGGLEEIGEELHAFAWMVIFGPDELMGKSRTATFVLPPAVAELILVEGKELGEADDVIFEKTNSKQSSGAVGILTHGLIDRANYYAQALTLALVPFKNPHLYKIEQAEALEAEA